MKVANLIFTYNEKDNVGPMIETLEKIAKECPKYDFLTLIVDSHSPDGTGEIVKKMAAKRKNLFLLETPRGLGISVIQGLKHAMEELKADIVIPNDVDFQWDPNLIPGMLKKMEEGYDVVVASRHIKGGKDNFSAFRKLTHFVSNTLFNYYWAGIHEAKDLAGNFKAIRVKNVLDRVELDKLNVRGFVIQSTMIYELSRTGAKFAEIPAVFQDRRAGTSKVGINAQFIKDILETIKNSTRIRFERSPGLLKFVKFGTVGFAGYLVNASTLFLFANLMKFPEWTSWGLSTELAIISNFTWNNIWTFQSDKITGTGNLARKFAQFNGTSLGALLIQTAAGTFGTKIFGADSRQILLPFIILFLVLPYNYTMYNLVIWKKKK